MTDWFEISATDSGGYFCCTSTDARDGVDIWVSAEAETAAIRLSLAEAEYVANGLMLLVQVARLHHEANPK